MSVQTLSDNTYLESYNILCHSHELSKYGHSHPFYLSTCKIAPLGGTIPHHHGEAEKFFILSGRGELELGEERQQVKAGDIVHIPPFVSHQLSNTDPENDLVFHSLYYYPDVFDAPQIVISAPPTPNGPMHLGHLSGPYLAADFFKRANRNTLHLTGTDDHQTYVQFLIETTKSQASTESFQMALPRTIEKANISVDIFQRPAHEAEYRESVLENWQKLKASKYVELKEVELPFCVSCDIFRLGAFVSGLCPHCNSTTNGGACEACHHPNRQIDLENAECGICG